MDKRGITELVQQEVVKLIIVALIAAILVYFIASSTNGELSKLILKSRENALWLDAGFNADKNSETTIDFTSDSGEYEISIDTEIAIKKKSEILGQSYRLFKNSGKELEMNSNKTIINITTR